METIGRIARSSTTCRTRREVSHMTMTPSARRFALTAHVTASVGWLGALAVFFAHALASVVSESDRPLAVATGVLLLKMQPISHLAEAAAQAGFSRGDLIVALVPARWRHPLRTLCALPART
jgi:hypothetical protein